LARFLTPISKPKCSKRKALSWSRGAQGKPAAVDYGYGLTAFSAAFLETAGASRPLAFRPWRAIGRKTCVF